MTTSKDTMATHAPKIKENSTDPWLSRYSTETQSLHINPQRGDQIWTVRRDGAIETTTCSTRALAGVEPFPDDVGFGGERAMPTLRALIHKFTFADRRSRLDLVIMVWLVCVFLRGLLTSKPLMLLTGPIGSGKTMFGRLIGRVLLGREFEVARLPPDERAYAALMTSSPYVVLDNVEAMPRWMPEDLAAQVTGGTIPLRKLYSDTTLLYAKLVAHVAISTATPAWLTTYLLDRSLVIPLTRPKVRIPDERLDAWVHTSRSAILSECLTVARLAHLAVLETEPTTVVDFRLADFALYGSVVATIIEGPAGKRAFEAALARMSADRLHLAEENDPVLAALISIARTSPPVMTNGQLMNRLVSEMGGVQASASLIGNPTELGKAIASLRTRTTGLIDIQKTTRRGRAMYRLTLAGGVGWGGSPSSSHDEEEEELSPHPTPTSHQPFVIEIDVSGVQADAGIVDEPTDDEDPS